MNEKIKAAIELADGREINLELLPEAAPLSVKNFVALCERGFYDGLCFHRVIPGFMVQGGGFADKGGRLLQKEAGAPVPGEFAANGRPNPLAHKPGVLSMARTNDPDSAPSQFFICVDDCAYLDGQYAAFGRCADDESLAVAVDISKVPTRSVGWYDDVPVTPVVIRTIKIEHASD